MMVTNENLTDVYHNEANQALAGLRAYKAKVDKLKEDIQTMYKEAKAGSRTRRVLNNIFKKLNELGKWS